MNWLKNWRGWVSKPRLGAALLSLAVWAGSSGCALTLHPWSYRVQIPELRAAPVELGCRVGGTPDICLLVLREDWEALVRELKAACLALGGTPRECQAE